MAFTRSWDESLPDGATTAAADIDLVFRQLKEDIRERLEDVSSFGSDTEPLVLNAGSARVAVGTNAERPASPTNEGELFYETDTERMFLAEDDGGLKWVLVGGGGLSGVGEFRYIEYDDSFGAGSKVTEEDSPGVMVYSWIRGTTDGSGDLILDYSEAGISSKLADLQPDPTGDVPVLASPVGRLGAINAFQVIPISWAQGTQQLTLRFFDSGGSAVTTTLVTASVLALFQQI